METDVTVDDLKRIDAEVDTRDLQTRGIFRCSAGNSVLFGA
jgi:hypothetical protein